MASFASSASAANSAPQFSIPLEFKLVEREVPDLDSSTNSGIRRGKIKEHDTPRWTSTWIPWDNHMDMTVFLRNLQRELAAVGLAATRDVDRSMRARIGEYMILHGRNQPQDEARATMNKASIAHQPVTPAAVAPIPMQLFAASTAASKKRSRNGKRGRNSDDDDEYGAGGAKGGKGDDEDDDDAYHLPKKLYSASATSKYSTRSAGLPSGTPIDSASAGASTLFDPGMKVTPIMPVKKKTKRCPSCQESVLANAKECSACGYEWSSAKKVGESLPMPATNTPVPDSGPLGKGKKRCRQCQGVIASSKRECPLCQADCVKHQS